MLPKANMKKKPSDIDDKSALARDCAHCERKMCNFAGGYSRGYNNELLCLPNAKNRPDCYALVTRYNHSTPCDRKTCYEDHEDIMTYVNGK